MNSISLSGLTTRVQEAIALNFQKPVWVRAEISELRENAGHCYMELIEKSEDSDAVLAKCRATCWASIYRMLKPYFESSTGQTFRGGLKVLISVTVEFHGVYGFSLNVRDIDPVYTVGEMAARRMEIIRQLEADGIADMNKLLSIPQPTQRIAVISSPTAAGYDDFCNQLRGNSEGYIFYMRLFPAIMQGENAEASIILALENIFEESHLFDVVVIIRGGGATADLASFDSYQLALNCAQFPLPIISGIGHHRDVSILDMVANTSVKTPTAAAEFLISNLNVAEIRVDNLISDIGYIVGNRLDWERRNISEAELRIKHALKSKVVNRIYYLDSQRRRLQSNIRVQLLKHNNKLDLLEKKIESHSPAFLLEHGYTITTLNGKRITSVVEIKQDDFVKTHLTDGSFDSSVKCVEKKS